MRKKFINFLTRVAKIPDGILYPRWIKFFIWLLFPVDSFLYQRFDYDPSSASVYIYGQRIPKYYFLMLGGKGSDSYYQEYYKFDRDKKGELIITRHVQDLRPNYAIEVLEKMKECGVRFNIQPGNGEWVAGVEYPLPDGNYNDVKKFENYDFVCLVNAIAQECILRNELFASWYKDKFKV